MLTFKPVHDERSLKTLFNAGVGFVGYIAMQNGKPLGSCLFKLDDIYLDIIRNNYTKNEPYVGEGLIRAALNYAANRNVYIARIDPIVGGNLAMNLGFVLKDGQLQAEIPEILRKDCTAV